MPKLYVIAGHGAGDPGAVGGGYTEAALVRMLANRIKELGGDEVVLHDTSRDAYASNDLSWINPGCPIVELHMDSASASAKGAHVVISSMFTADSKDKALAASLSSFFPGRSNTIVGRSDLQNVNVAASRGLDYRLTENGFISNADDRTKFINNIDKIARMYLEAFGVVAVDESTGWKKDSKGWWYRMADGKYPVKTWMKIDKQWYWFNESGYAVKGWNLINNEWYYFNQAGEGTECAMRRGWYADKQGNVFYLRKNKEGTHPEGSMFTGTKNISCTFDKDGYLQQS